MIIRDNIITAQSKQFYPEFFIPNAMSYDIETYPEICIFGGENIRTGKVFGMVMKKGQPFDRDRLRRLMQRYYAIGYNSQNFDIPLTALALEGADTDEIKSAANHIIQGGIKWWDVEKALGIHIPKWMKTSDLMEVNPAIMQSLKTMGARLGIIGLESLPYPHDAILDGTQEINLCKYWVKDLKATTLLAHTLEGDLQLREAIGKDIGIDLMSKSDSQMGFAIIKKRIEDLRGERIKRTEINTSVSFKYTAPDYIKFETPQLQGVLDKIHAHQFVTKSDGKVDLPKWLADERIQIGPMAFQMGIGGLHSTESNRCVIADASNAIVSVDVAGMYPRLIINQGKYPEAVGPDFITVYNGIYDDRIKAKHAKEKVKDKALKIALNGGGFGRLGSRYSITFAPHMLIDTTLTGQLSLLMLIERANLKGIPVVSANTDGVEFFCPRQFYAGFVLRDDGSLTDRLKPSVLCDIVEQWERDTQMVLEGVEYTALYNQSVNSYIALKADGSHKRKGPISNPWNKDKSDFDPRGQMSKNPQLPICSDAALYFLKYGTPIEDTIRACKDVKMFVTVVNATGGAGWTEPGTTDEEYLGGVVRYYYSTNGAPIIKVKAHPSTGNRPKVSKTDGCRPLMTLPDDFAVPADLDYSRYVAEAESILRDIGYYNRETVAGASPWESVLNRALQIN